MKELGNETAVRSLLEQGDMGLFGDPLSESDQKQYIDQMKKQQQENEDKQ